MGHGERMDGMKIKMFKVSEKMHKRDRNAKQLLLIRKKKKREK